MASPLSACRFPRLDSRGWASGDQTPGRSEGCMQGSITVLLLLLLLKLEARIKVLYKSQVEVSFIESESDAVNHESMMRR